MTSRKLVKVRTIRRHMNSHQIQALKAAVRSAPMDVIMRRELTDILDRAVAITVTKVAEEGRKI